MIALIRLAVVAFVAMTVFYLLLSIYSRSLRREALEKQWDAGQGPGERQEFIATGMSAYEKGLRRKLLWLVYVIPTVVIVTTVYFMNFY